jgi:hypothetical protein
MAISRATALAPVREFLFRTVSQLGVNYRGMPLAAGVAGRVHGGDRLPWVTQGASDNFAPLRQMQWQVHVYGEAAAPLRAACQARALPLQVFPWTPAHESAGLCRDACYLLRPDSYVALADGAADPGALARYFRERALRRPA